MTRDQEISQYMAKYTAEQLWAALYKLAETDKVVAALLKTHD